MPPTKPTLPVFEVLAAITPTRKEPSCSLNYDRLHIGLVDDSVDDGEFGVREFVGDLAERGRPGEADGHDRREAVFGEFAQDLLALRVVLDFEIAVGDAAVLLELFGAVEDAFVEGFVELAAEVVDDGGLDLGRVGRAEASSPPAMRAVVMRLDLRPNILDLPVMASAESGARPMPSRN